MEPIRDRNATLVDLLDRILDKGLVLYADVIISVAGIPLIGVNLRAAIAGMETMLEYGMMRDWDEATRLWETEHRKEKKLSLIEREEIIQSGKMWYYAHSDGIMENTWKHGSLHLTNKRLCWYYGFDGKIAFEIPVNGITNAVVEIRNMNNMQNRKRVLVVSHEKGDAYFSGDRKLMMELERILKDIIRDEMEVCPNCGNSAPARELLSKGCSACEWISPRMKKQLLVPVLNR